MWLCRIDDCVDDEYLRDDEEKQKGSWLEDIEDDEEILTDVVTCPGVIFPPLKHSCYVSRESVFGPPPDEMGRVIVEPRRRTYDEKGRIIIEPRSSVYDKTKRWLSDNEQNKNEYPISKNSCYVSRETVFGPSPDENNNPLQTEQDGPVLTKKLTPPKK